MSGCIIKCPKCGKGHLRNIKTSFISTRHQRMLTSREKMFGGVFAPVAICPRCGFMYQANTCTIINDPFEEK